MAKSPQTASPSERDRGMFELLLEDEGGAAYLEYLTITILVGFLAATALVAVGVPLLESFQYTQLFLAAPIP